MPLNLWYMIPVKACMNRRNLISYPKSKNLRGHYEKYREAWWRLQIRNIANRSYPTVIPSGVEGPCVCCIL